MKLKDKFDNPIMRGGGDAESEVGVPIGIVSVGPDRKQTIKR